MSEFYEELEHTADWTVRVRGESLPALFQNAARAMFELSGADLTAEPVLAVQVRCQGVDREALFIAWLNELIFLSETHDALFTRFQVRIEPASDAAPAAAGELLLTAQAQGLAGRGHLAHIKAVTYWDLAIIQDEEGWQATVTFDT